MPPPQLSVFRRPWLFAGKEHSFSPTTPPPPTNLKRRRSACIVLIVRDLMVLWFLLFSSLPVKCKYKKKPKF